MTRDTLVMAERNLVRLPRNPDMLLAFTVQPIMFVLLFAYVFGGAIATPGFDDYIDFLIPGMIVQQIAFGGFATALGLAEDMTKGLIDRFRSLPTARASVLAGRTLADVATNLLSIVILVATGLIIGFRFDATRAGDPRRPRPAAAVRLRVLVDLRADRDERLLARGGQRRRLHADLPDHVHLVRVRAGGVDAGRPRAGRRRQPGQRRRGRDARAVARRAGRQQPLAVGRVVRRADRGLRAAGRGASTAGPRRASAARCSASRRAG